MPHAMAERSPLTILLAEDDDGHALLVEKNLRRVGLGSQVLRFRDGAETLAYLRQDHAGEGHSSSPRVLLLDLNMPGVDGLAVLEKLRQDERTRTIPVIVLSTTHTSAEIQRCYELGCNAFVTKPVDYGQFTESIKKLAGFFAILELPDDR